MELTDIEHVRLALSVHEAGHAVTAALFGAHVGEVMVAHGGPRIAPDGMAGFCRFHDGDFVTRMHRPEIFAAGVAAQALWQYGPRPTAPQFAALLRHNHQDDRQLRRLAAVAGDVPISPSAVLPLVSRCWPAITELAVKLFQDKPVGHREVCAALKMPIKDNAHHRAAVLSGAVPGSFTIAPAARHLVAV